MSHAMDISRITKDIFEKYPKEKKSDPSNGKKGMLKKS